jgi:hypothetical protein
MVTFDQATCRRNDLAAVADTEPRLKPIRQMTVADGRRHVIPEQRLRSACFKGQFIELERCVRLCWAEINFSFILPVIGCLVERLE